MTGPTVRGCLGPDGWVANKPFFNLLNKCRDIGKFLFELFNVIFSVFNAWIDFLAGADSSNHRNDTSCRWEWVEFDSPREFKGKIPLHDEIREVFYPHFDELGGLLFRYHLKSTNREELVEKY